MSFSKNLRMASESKIPVCISVINMKGGVGKTTVAAMLGRYASIELGLKVLAIDLDPQANLSQAFMLSEYTGFLDSKKASVVELFNSYVPPAAGVSSPAGIAARELLVGNTALGGKNLSLLPSRFDFSENLIDSAKMNPHTLAQVIAQEFQDQDIVLIDCAPTESILTKSAYHASRYILVPVRPEYFATIGFPLLEKSLADFRLRNPAHSIDVAGIVINNSTYHYSNGGPEREKSIAEIRHEASRSGWRIFETEIPLSRGFPKIMRGNFSHLGDANQFRNFAIEFFQLFPGLSRCG